MPISDHSFEENTAMRFELADCAATILREIADRSLHQRDIAQTYRLAMESSESVDWPAVNQAIVERWSRSGLQRIKEAAWSGRCFRERISNV